MITEEQKEKLLNQWDTCNPAIKLQIAATFLKKIKSGKQQQNWWIYLEENLPKSTRSNAR